MILITGANGNVGREVVKQALSVGLTIRATFQSPDIAARAPAGPDGVVMDYTKPETIRPALDEVQKIFLVGPPTRELSALEARFIKESAGQWEEAYCQTLRPRRPRIHVPERTSRFGREHRSLRSAPHVPSTQRVHAKAGQLPHGHNPIRGCVSWVPGKRCRQRGRCPGYRCSSGDGSCGHGTGRKILCPNRR